MEKRGNFLCKFIFNCVKDSKLQNGTKEACKYCVNLMLHQCKIKYSLQLKKLKFLYLLDLQLAWPLPVAIFLALRVWEAFGAIQDEKYLKWQYFGRNDNIRKE